MTNQEFNASYQLLKQVADGEVRTFHALAATGAVVMVHLLRADAADRTRALLRLVDRLPPPHAERIIAVTDVEGAPLIVSRFLLEFSSLRDWLEKTVGEAGATTEAASHPTAIYERAPGVTQSAAAPTTPAAAPTAPVAAPTAPVAVPPPQAAPPPPAAQPLPARAGFAVGASDAPAAREPGEFTRMFRSVEPAGPAAMVPPVVPPVVPATSAQPAMDAPRPDSDPGFGGAPRADPPHAQPAPVPGEFTRMFRAQQPGPVPPQPASPTPPAPPDTSGGEFTRMFRSADVTQPPPSAEQPGPPPEPPVPGQPRPDPTRPPSEPRPEPPRHPDPSHPPAPPGPGPQRHPDPTHPALPPVEPVRPGAPDLAARAGQAAPRSEPQNAPGEFTRTFGAPARPEDLPPPARSAPPPNDPWRMAEPPRPAPAQDGPGNVPQPPPPAVPQAKPMAGPGEFTRIFGAQQAPGSGGQAGGHPPQPSRPPQAPPQPAPPQQAPSEFTQMFGAQSAPPPGPPPAQPGGHWAPGGGAWNAPAQPAAGSAGPADDYLSRLGSGGGFRPPPAPPSVPKAPSVPTASVPIPPHPSAAGGWNLDLPRPPAPPPGPGEFTRIIATPTPMQGPLIPQMPKPPGMAAPAAAPAAATAQPAGKPPSKIWLIVGLTAVAILTIVIILVLVLASRPAAAPAVETPPAAPAAAPGTTPPIS